MLSCFSLHKPDQDASEIKKMSGIKINPVDTSAPINVCNDTHTI